MTQSHVLILQHVPWEKPGRILDSLDDLGMSYEVMNIAKEKKPDLPDFSDVSGIVIMGGPMGALDTDKYPGLKAESKLVRAAVSVGKPLLGVCLGHLHKAGVGVDEDIRSLPPRWARNSRRAASRKSDSRRLNASTSTTTSPCGTRRWTCCTGTTTW